MSDPVMRERIQSDLDLFSPELVSDPYPALAMLREQGPVVYMSAQDYWLLTRYDDVRAATQDWQTYSSAQGVGLFPMHNENIAGTILGTDPPEHDRLREVLADKLAPRALRGLRDRIATKADALVADLVGRGRFDGAVDLARIFPVDVVADLVGLPQEGRHRLHPGADAVFTAFGPFTPVLQERLPLYQEYWQYIAMSTNREDLAPGSWGAEVVQAVEDGRLTMEDGISTLGAYLTAGMDTTVNAIAAMLRRFAEEPVVWDALRADPTRVGPFFEETLRIESPVQGFFRVTTREVEIGSTTVPAGERVMVHWGAANRDARHYSDPDTFDLTRNPVDHLAFGSGVHACVGQGLARLEVAALLEALLPRVRRFTLTGPVVQRYNPVVRSLDSVPLEVVPDAR